MLTKFLASSGFFTLEFLVVIAIFMTTSMFFYVPAQSLLRQQYAIQLRLAAQELAADIRAAQQRAMFSNVTKNRIILLEDKQSYIIEASNKLVSFSKLSWEGVYFAKTASNYISYSNIGAPSTAGDYVLKHYKDANISYTLTIQPSSGRVDIHEK